MDGATLAFLILATVLNVAGIISILAALALDESPHHDQLQLTAVIVALIALEFSISVLWGARLYG